MDKTPSKFAKLGLCTSTITNIVSDYASTERLYSIFQTYKSGFVVASVWLALKLRSWLGALPLPIPSLTTLPLVLLVLISISLSNPPRTLVGLAYYTYNQICACCDLFSNKIYPEWLPLTLLAVALLPLSRVLPLLILVAVWASTKSYRDGVATVVVDVDKVICQATSAAGRAEEHVREAQTLEMQAMRLVSQTVNPAIAVSIKELKKEAEEIVADVGVPARLEAMVDAVRKLAERVKEVAEEGDLELAVQMVKNTQNLVERVEHVEEMAHFKVGELKKKLWGLTLGTFSL